MAWFTQICLFCSLWVLFLLGSPLQAERPEAERKPFERVLVLGGGDANTTVFDGMMAGLAANQDNPWIPNLIIPVCGAGAQGAAVLAHPDAKKRKEFLFSTEYHQLLLSPTLNYQVCTAERLESGIGELKQRNLTKPSEEMPIIFKTALYEVPNVMNSPSLSIPFSSDGTRVLMLGCQVLFTPEEAEKGGSRMGRKLYEQVFITDPDTAKYLEGYQSTIAKLYPTTSIKESTQVLTDLTALQGVRINISDPSLMNPAEIKGKRYLGGSVDHYPVELAKFLGNEVVMTYSAPFTDPEYYAHMDAIGYDSRKRLKSVKENSVTHWIRFNDMALVYAESGMGPKVDYLKALLQKFSPPDPPPSTLEEFKKHACLSHGVPKDYEEFKRRQQALWKAGFERGKEAALTKINDKSHVLPHDKGPTAYGATEADQKKEGH